MALLNITFLLGFIFRMEHKKQTTLYGNEIALKKWIDRSEERKEDLERGHKIRSYGFV